MVVPRVTLLAFLCLSCRAEKPAVDHHLGPRGLEVRVFYDENGNGSPDPGETARLPGARVSAGAHEAGVDPATGRAVFAALGPGRTAIRVEAASLPPFFLPPAPLDVVLEPGERREVVLPVTLPIGDNRPHTYLAFGDSLTSGVGYTDGQAYRARLQAKLAAFFGRAEVIDGGASGTRTNQGARRIAEALARTKPAYVLVQYGTNDWNFPSCKQVEGCFTLKHMPRILQAIRTAHSLPCVATLVPPNVGFDQRVPPERDEWVSGVSEEVRRIARDEGALLVDLQAAFVAQPARRGLFTDHLHPNESGFALMADTFFRALTVRATPR